MKRLCSAFILLAALVTCVCEAEEITKSNKQRRDLEEMLTLFPKSEPWEQWLEETGELPPDFDALPSRPFLPDCLQFENGEAVRSASDWPKRRAELMKLLHYYVIGSVPPAPDNMLDLSFKNTRAEKLTCHKIEIAFGPQRKARLHLELIMPNGEGPFPVFITQDNHRRWALIAASRGYIGCVYAGADSNDDTGDFIPIWPDYDWTKLARRAWAASRCIDYLYTYPEVDRSKIAITGHSRNGKLSLIAGAIDERITAVISSSSGAGGACSYRLFSETQFGEGIELITRDFPDWLHPRLRFFAGRENKLPIDQHQMIACIAPRPCLISTALNDQDENPWSIEQTYYAAKKVYSFLGAANNLQLLYRPGGHSTRAEDIERYLDWLDVQFGRGTFDIGDEPIYPTYDDWLEASGETIDPKGFPARVYNDLLLYKKNKPIASIDEWRDKRQWLIRRVQWGLGEAPPLAQDDGGTYGSEPEYASVMLWRFKKQRGIEKRKLNFGNYVSGNLFFPEGADQDDKKIPGIIWLHPLSCPSGYHAGYFRGQQFHHTLAKEGFAVFTFDQIGHGLRVEEASSFYQRYPQWSLLGKTVEDIKAARQVFEQFEFVDMKRIYLVGYDTGTVAALHAAALDHHFAGVVSIAGFTPMRRNTADKGTGGIARLSKWFPFQPRLAAFIGYENRIPYDYHDVLALIATRPVLVVAPKIDYLSSLEDIEYCVEQAKKVYERFEAANNLQLYIADDYNHLSPTMQKEIIQRFKQMIETQP